MNVVERLRAKAHLTIHVCAPSDVCRPGLARNLWGDNWVKESLTEEFRRMGHTVLAARPDQQPPDVLIHLSGGEIEYVLGKRIEQFAPDTYKVVWVYSHPEKPTPTNLRGYHRVFCCSVSFTETLRRMGYAAEPLLGATNKRPLPSPLTYDVVFVGNNRGPSGKDGRKVIHGERALGSSPL